jgi:ArsR family transcriptional regulator
MRATVADLDLLFRGFADPTRLRIMNLLAGGELCVRDVVEVLGLPQPTVSRHLAYLRRAGLVEATREWNLVRYRLADPNHPVHQNLIACVRDCFRGIRSLDRERAQAAELARKRERQPC